jgi:hypothetical protein
MDIPIFPIRVNGHCYEWADIQLSIAGSTPQSTLQEINYSSVREGKNIYGTGSEPIGVGYGNRVYSGSITMLMDEVQALLAIAPLKDLSRIPSFSITVSWLDAENVTITDVLKNCKFMNYDIKTKQGDTSTPVTLNILFAGIA